MGTWGTAISSNDTYTDIYGEFFDLYNDGLDVPEISRKLISDNQETINDPDESNDFWFALAKAQWECKQLDKELLDRVKKIIDTDADIELWRELEADEKDIKKRKIVLDKFLADLQTEKPKAKSRRKKIIRQPVFEKGDCLTFKLDNGNYGGAIVLSAEYKTRFGFNLISVTRINQPKKPNLKDYLYSEVLYTNCPEFLRGPFIGWYPANGYRKNYINVFECIGNIDVKSTFDFDGEDNSGLASMYCGDWIDIVETTNKQIEYEQSNEGPDETTKIKELL